MTDSSVISVTELSIVSDAEWGRERSVERKEERESVDSVMASEGCETWEGLVELGGEDSGFTFGIPEREIEGG